MPAFGTDDFSLDYQSSKCAL